MTHVARSKTTVPGPPPELIRRPDLLAALDRGEDSALTLVCAPPGYGKTSLLSDWVRRQDIASVWVGLEEEDDDAHRLWSAVLSALVACPAVPADSRLRGLVVPRTSVGADFLTDLCEALGDVREPLRLVLDDAHHLRSRQTLHGLDLLVRNRSGHIHLVLASRFDPALPIARLRLEEQLCEVRTEQLAFSAEETAVLTGLCGLGLTPEQVGVLHARTDGWVAGIRLAILPLRDHEDPERFLAAFSGDERPVADYLAGEVFPHVPEEAGELLRRTSISDPIPAALAVELSGWADAADVLTDLERSTGLVVATGPHRTEFRVQELLRSYLTADLHRSGPALAADLHHRAATWWAARGRPVEALRHAAQACNGSLMTSQFHRWAPELVACGEHTALRRTLSAAKGAATAPDAWLPLVSAQMSLGRGDLRAARAEVRLARTLDTGPDDRDLALFRAATSRLAGLSAPDLGDATAPDDPALAALTLAGRATAGIFPDGGRQAAGALDIPEDLEAALTIARDQHFGLLEIQCLCLIGAAAASAGDHARATAAATAALTAAAAHGWHDSPWTATAQAVLAYACLMRAIPVRALAAAAEGLRICPAEQDPTVRFVLRAVRGGALFDLGDRTGGLLELHEAVAELGGRGVPAPVAAWAALLEHRAALLLGSSAAASTAMSRLAGRGCADAEVTLMRAWVEAAAGTPLQARATVVPLLDGSQQPALRSTLVEAWLVEVWGALRLGDRPGARRALQDALACAEPQDLLRPFALAGQGIRVLLVDQLGGARDPAMFAFRCLAARQRVRQASTPQLSAREHDVLVQLLSLSNLGEIAEDLAVSVNTIKSHVRAIYGKLGVSTRRTAVLTAVERGLLT